MRIRTSSLALALLVAASLSTSACTSGYRNGRGAPLGSTGTTGDFSLNRGDWLMGDQVGLWAVLSQPRSGAPQRLGYVSERHYREVRGGPVFALYEVTALDRDQRLGTVDSLGNAVRFHPRRGGGVDSESVGNATLVLSVQAIFGEVRPITLEPTTERVLAFEALDKNHDGFLDKDEWSRISDRVHSPDTNRDGKVDFQEFDQFDDL